jgi:hypothetical protein
MNLLKRANETKVDPQLMGEILEAVADLPADDRDFEGTTIEIVKRVHELDLPDEQRGDLAMAINFRLMALARLMEKGGGRGWTAPGKEGCTFVHEELVQAAAEEPMIEVESQITFDPESFHRRLLALAEPHGEA